MTFLCLPQKASVLPKLSIIGLSMPFDTGFRFDSVERRDLWSLLLSFRCLPSMRPVCDLFTTILPFFEKLFYSWAKVKAQGWLYYQNSALFRGFFLTYSIIMTSFFHSGGISVVFARTYIEWSFLYDVIHPVTKYLLLSLQIFHTYRVLITCWKDEKQIIVKV